ncbi:SusC/RagA family TonB-linked outer membrane protein [Flavobacterium sp. FlaQc-47]|uniref:SusC/RagA family TonB-linked outer membrane protein n=1 Tax=Flavobacterium sp. FlaQc-47 TaxID=3374180 RepID=UPI0037564E6D
MNNFSFYKDGGALYCLIFLGSLLSFSSLSAKSLNRNFTPSSQQHQIQGIVTDGSVPLPGVSILVKNRTNTSAITDYNGQYSLSASANDTLVVSFIGFKTAILAVNGRTKIDITLISETTTLQEVRINAGYYTVKESERTGNIARITAKDIENQPVTNILATMQGRMPGVFVTQTTGTPGGGFDIKIRGQNSLRLNANNPLYIIDGVPYSSDPIGSGTPSAVLPTQPNPLNSINPDQIESVEVLKDADATAIYGSRGANGVVLITTKSGKAGKTKFSAKVYTGAATVTHFMDLMNTEQYIQMRKEAYNNDGIKAIPSSAYDVNGTWDQKRYTNWQKEILGGTAEINNLQASLSGGSAQTQFLVSGNYNYQGTILPQSFRYKKGNFHVNVNHQSENKRFKANITFGYTLQDNNQPRVDLMRETIAIAPNAPALYNADGSLNWENNTYSNPLRNLTGKYKALTNDLMANMLLSYDLLENVKLQTNIGYTNLINRENTTNPSTRFNPSSGFGPENSTLIVGDFERKSWIIEPQLNWSKSFGSSTVNALAGGTFQSQQANLLVQYASGFASNSLINNLSSATTISILQTDQTVYKYQAFFARINYNFKERYIINLTGRRDGSSRFGPGNQFANFGAVGAAWLFSRENLFKNSSFLSFGKLRASYGTTGSDQIGDYQYMDTYSISGSKYGGISGLQPSRLFNPEFGWETNKKLEAALEVGFLADRIFLTSSYYENRSSNQLTGIPLPGTTGFTSIQANLNATVQNKGIELSLRTVNLQNNEWNWTSSFNLTFAKTKLLEFPNLTGSTYANTLVIGKPLNIRKVYHYTGVDPNTGIYNFEDINKDGSLTSLDDKKAIIDLSPQYYGGLQNTLRYKNWNLDFLLQFAKQKNYSATSYFGIPGSQTNQLAEIADRWKEPGNTNAYQIFTSGTNSKATTAYGNYAESDGPISDTSFIRLKNISISYDIPLKDFKCRIFFEGQNLLTFTKYNGPDPEFTAVGYLPPLKVFAAGLQFNF